MSAVARQRELQALVRESGLALRRGEAHPHGEGSFSLTNLAGRVVELSNDGASCALTLAFALILEAQHSGEPAAWVSSGPSTFYPPDAAAGGVDLSALPVIKLPDIRKAVRAADHLARSGAFGLLILDLGERGDLPQAILTRLTGQASRHHMAILCLTQKKESAPSLGSLVSLRGHATRTRLGENRFSCELRAIKDKRCGPGWTHEEVCCGPTGLR